MPNILGINLSGGDEELALKKVQEFLNSDSLHYAVTPNPEIILLSQLDSEFAEILNKADLSLADGFGLKIAGFITKQKITRITGADLSLKILALAEKQTKKVAIINWEKGLSSGVEIKQALQKKYPQLRCLVIDVPRAVNLESDKQDILNNFAPKIVFTTLGFPYQEKIIFNNLNNWPSVRLAIGVGGTFDFITKKAQRAPKVMRKAGLEWLWRLGKQPRRLGRIYRATFIFMSKILLKNNQK
ncbi:MAG TPA: WecB/TagA/CpsF family glycosyltransferase [Candidatus Saccharimonadales bacterium]|nr:WecB/TagA/CpsF family glycosyltransferase [Candidatus Saccharimonadales bacterium]